ncbi:MAG TPA: 5'-nucleotidase [Bacteroidia bacterium]|nr:5'-nucleotidase [Bacteroidia bacterium]
MKGRLVPGIIISLLFSSCHRHLVRTEERQQHYSLKGNPANSVIDDSLRRFKKKVDAETSRIIGVSDKALTKQGDECNLGNFVCDALYSGAVKHYSVIPDIVVVNRGGLRTDLPEGEIRVLNVFELMPFENELVILRMKGAELNGLIEKIHEKKHPFRGMKLKEEKRAEILIGEKLLDQKKEYSIATSDYLAEGGDGFIFFTSAKMETKKGIKIRDAIIEYCEKETEAKRKITANKDGRYE